MAVPNDPKYYKNDTKKRHELRKNPQWYYL